MRKLTMICFAGAAALAPCVHAVPAGAELLFVNDPEAGSSFVLNDASGNLLESGCMAIGQLSSDTVLSGTAAEIFTDFSREGNYADIIVDDEPKTGNYLEGESFSASTHVNETFSGTLYFFVGNGANVASSTQFTLFSFQNLTDSSFFKYEDLEDVADMVEFYFASDDVIRDGEMDWAPRLASDVLGAVLASDETLTVNLTAAVPEPSAFGILAGLGAFALAFSRRRRKS